MQDRVTYEFAIIRVVPKVEREEFMNVGVILFSKPKKYLGIKFQLDENRLKAFSSGLDLELVNSYLNGWELVCQGGRKAGRIGEMELPYRFRWLVASRSTIIQSSKTHAGLCHEPEKVLESLFEKYVL
ncbi:MAG: hypothetical protein ACJAWV_000721 [Flammeovirgaceae bacterium]|jgi:hypothetical protein